MGHRHRWWYRLTGLPGWMRFGFSPGWVGRSFLGFPMPGFPTPYDPYGAAQITPEQELDMLKGQSEVLEDELDGIRKRITELEEEKK